MFIVKTAHIGRRQTESPFKPKWREEANLLVFV